MSETTTGRNQAAGQLAVMAAQIAHQDNCEDILVLDLRGISPVTDYFVIATGTSDRQMRTVAQDITQYAKSVDQAVWRTAGMETSEWIVLDLVNVVVHLFDQTHRRYYDLELIWGEAPRVSWRDGSDQPET